jgi:asparagine synthase (glutamine-hydrolysing)
MCGIAGIVDSDETANKQLERMLEAILHRGPDGAGYVIDGHLERKHHFKDLDFGGKKGNIAIGHVRLAITGGVVAGLQPFQTSDKKLSLLHNGEIYNYRQLRNKFCNDMEFETDTDSEVILKLLEKEYDGDLVKAMREVLPKLDGVYALAVSDHKQIVIARDKIGVRQLYFLEDSNYQIFASEKKSLLAISDQHEKIKRLQPGHLAILNGREVRTFPFWSPESLKPSVQIEDMDRAIEVYGEAITRAMAKRVAGRERVGIIFSGGIDSVLIAYLTQKMDIPFTCYTAGMEGASDIEWAENIADRLNFPLKVKTLSPEEIEQLIPQVITDIEDQSLNQVEVSIPIYASVRMAQEEGERVILTGQGADELFGGYPWYAKIVHEEGYKSFEKYSWEDTCLLYKECLEREDKIAMAHSQELRVPFLDPEVIQAAFEIAPELKISGEEDSLLKIIHRQYCLSIGIHQDIAFREKEAAQHGANVHEVFEELAEKHNNTEKKLNEAGYDLNKSVNEKLGSSSRYGFRYGDRHLWKPLLSVQYYLDTHAAKLDLLPPKSKQHWKEVTSELQAVGCA